MYANPPAVLFVTTMVGVLPYASLDRMGIQTGVSTATPSLSLTAVAPLTVVF